MVRVAFCNVFNFCNGKIQLKPYLVLIPGKIISVTTSGVQAKSVFLNDMGVEVTGQKTLIMDIKACAEAVIQFAQTQQLDGGFFEVD